MLELFQFTMSPWELVFRGTVIYWFLFLLFRFLLRRNAGSLGIADILVIVLIADAAQNGMAGEYKTISEAMVLIGTIGGWNYFINWMSYHFPWFAKFADPSVLPLIQEGSVLDRNLARELVTKDELLSQLRQNGIEGFAAVKMAALEPDGHISIIRQEQGSDSLQKGKRQTGIS